MSLKYSQLISLAKKYGTPLYVYDGDLILQRYRELYEFIPYKKLKIFYAMKANSNFQVLKLLAREGASLDTVSPTEALLGLKAGFSPEKIIYTVSSISPEEIKMLKQKRVLLNIGSISALKMYGDLFPDSEVCLRFNPNVLDGHEKDVYTGGDRSQFGILLKDLNKTLILVEKYKLKVVGLHEHTGTGIKKTDSILKSMTNILDIASRKSFPHLRFVDFGGGFKVPYEPGEERVDYPAFGKVITKIFTEFCKKYGKEIDLYFEPGRFIVAESGHLLVHVNHIKTNRRRVIALTDSGFSQLIRPALHGSYHHIVNISNPKGEVKKYDICGNICETSDRFAEKRPIAEIREGDFLDIETAGAYGYTMASVYNLRPLPAEVVVTNGKSVLATKRLTNEELAERFASGKI